jgi:hypothetical protein
MWRIIYQIYNVTMSRVKNLRLGSFTLWVGLGITFSMYVMSGFVVLGIRAMPYNWNDSGRFGNKTKQIKTCRNTWLLSCIFPRSGSVRPTRRRTERSDRRTCTRARPARAPASAARTWSWSQFYWFVATKGANPTILIYNASVVIFYNAKGSLARFENKNILLYF